MKTKIDVPDDLLHEAMKVTTINDKTEVVVFALNQLIKRAKGSGSNGPEGKGDPEVDLTCIRGRR